VINRRSKWNSVNQLEGLYLDHISYQHKSYMQFNEKAKIKPRSIYCFGILLYFPSRICLVYKTCLSSSPVIDWTKSYQINLCSYCSPFCRRWRRKRIFYENKDRSNSINGRCCFLITVRYRANNNLHTQIKERILCNCIRNKFWNVKYS
jgi:hypothetical protein